MTRFHTWLLEVCSHKRRSQQDAFSVWGAIRGVVARGSEVGAVGVGVVFYLPVAVVGFVVAGVAEQHQVVLLGGSAVLPFDDVVGHAPFGFGPAAE